MEFISSGTPGKPLTMDHKSYKWIFVFAVLVLSLFLSLPAFALEQVKTVVDERTVRLDYVDENNNIVRHETRGYATILRTLDENGRALTDSYLDENGDPVPTSGAYYGVTRVYNDQGQVSEFIYLDKAGKPALTRYGYGILKRTYNEEGKADVDTYFDAEGNPVALSRRQYGYRRIYKDGKVVKIIYIDRNGKDMFLLDRFLQRRPWVVGIALLLILLAALVLGRRCRLLLFFSYILFILYMTWYVRESSEPHSNLDLFWSYRQMLETGVLRMDVLYNIALFVPLGFLSFFLFPAKGWIISFLLSVCVEVLQYVTGTGLCEFDDVFSNTLGGLIGFGLAMLAVRVFPKVKDGLILRRK